MASSATMLFLVLFLLLCSNISAYRFYTQKMSCVCPNVQVMERATTGAGLEGIFGVGTTVLHRKMSANLEPAVEATVCVEIMAILTNGAT